MADRSRIAIGLHDAVGQLWQLLFEAKIRSHGRCAPDTLSGGPGSGKSGGGNERGDPVGREVARGYTVQEQREPRAIWFLDEVFMVSRSAKAVSSGPAEVNVPYNSTFSFAQQRGQLPAILGVT